ncbi:fimbrial protein [Enterobacter cloacae complex sp. ECC445]|uniref:fimbrial protein n=1 Tax=Enterobacter cloacae complex sp. ECC445 TaxID=2913213 RepID=UPI003FA442EE
MMKTILLTGLLLAVASTANAEDEKSLVDTGTLFVHGDLQENTCRMTMDSAWQDVNLGTTSRAEVDHAGKAAEPVKVNIYLHDCPELASWSKNITPMTTTFSTLQPPYSARFMGVQDDYNPELIKVVGASGIGLRLRDSKGATVMLSHNSDSILLNPGQNQLTFTLQPERTTAPFVAGPYHALVNFSMIYQ